MACHCFQVYILYKLEAVTRPNHGNNNFRNTLNRQNKYFGNLIINYLGETVYCETIIYLWQYLTKLTVP